MNIIRYFIAQQDEEIGNDGWLPLWIPKSAGFNSFDITGCMHDMLEHQLCDRGHYHEEVMAFGRMAVLRGLTDTYSGRGRAYSAPQSTGIELSGIFCRASFPRLPEVAHTEAADSVFEDFLSEFLVHYRKSGNEEAAEYRDDEEPPFDDAHVQTVKNLMRLGYRDGLRRYGNPDHKAMDIANIAWGWAAKNKHFNQIAEEMPGCVLRLIVDTDAMRVQHTLIEPTNEYGEFPRWLRNRIWSWKNDKVASYA